MRNVVDNQLFSTICAAFNLGKLLSEPISIHHQRIWQLTTEKGVFAVKKLRIQTKNDLSQQNPLQGNSIAKVMVAQNIPAVTALNTDNGEVLLDYLGNSFMVFVWHEGKVLSTAAASIPCAYKIGVLLAHIHQLNLQLPEVTPAAWQVFVEPDWSWFVMQAQKKNLIWADLVANILPQIVSWSECYQVASRELQGRSVISHGDLIQANVIWSDVWEPWIIDWESAGWIHPEVELLGVALNWSGITTGLIEQTVFTVVFEGYRSIRLSSGLSRLVLYAGLGSWLKWLVVNMYRSLVQDEFAIEEVVSTLKTIQYLINSFSQLSNWAK